MPSTRISTRNASTSKATPAPTSSRARKTKKAAPPTREPLSEDEAEDSEDDPYQQQEDSDVESLRSDALDDDDDDVVSSKRKRKRVSSGSGSPKKANGKKNSSPRKKRKRVAEEDDDLDLEDGQEIVGEVVQAPKTGQVPPGQISKNTLNFLSQLKKPECNDREWFKLHELVYRQAEREWKDFIEAITDVVVENDPQIPHLPPKDVIHRIYRDIRFSNDKTPYKSGFSASLSRSGRKGIFAGYHISIIPGGKSHVAAGSWQPGKNELQTIRNNILRSSTRLRNIISSPAFVKLFGEAKPHPKGLEQNIFGMDELKVAPKGVPKTHKDIDLLKCRSFVVIHRFADEQVLDPNFKEEIGRIIEVLRPFVHYINDMMTIQPSDSDDDDEENGGDGGEEDSSEGEAGDDEE